MLLFCRWGFGSGGECQGKFSLHAVLIAQAAEEKSKLNIAGSAFKTVVCQFIKRGAIYPPPVS